MGTALTIAYQGDAAPSPRTSWLVAEQADMPGDGKVGWALLQQMLRYARMGVSATAALVAGCPVEIEGDTVRIPLKVNVYPSDMDMPYSLSPAYGEVVGLPTLVKVWREVDLVFDMQAARDVAELLIDPETMVYGWESPCFNERYQQIDEQPMTWSGGVFSVPQTLFGVARVKCQAIGWQHSIVMEFTRVADQKISGIENSVTITWAGEPLVVALKCPPCVEQLLNYCGRNSLSFGPKDPTVTKVDAWVNECSGELLKTVVTPPVKEPING